MKNKDVLILAVVFISIVIMLVYVKGKQRQVSPKTTVESVESSLFGGKKTEPAEQTGTYGLNDTYDNVINGARLILKFDSKIKTFVGTVENTTETTLSNVRVEVHQSNGIELGPTTPTDLRSGERINITLASDGSSFDKWTAHPEVGNNEVGHGLEGESSEGGGESSEQHTETSGH